MDHDDRAGAWQRRTWGLVGLIGALAPLLWARPAASGSLELQARFSGRPSSCLVAPSGSSVSRGRAGVWDEVRDAGRRELCQRLALVHLNLNRAPEVAFRIARDLTRELPAAAEHWALAARAKVQLGDYGEAWSLFTAARERGYDFTDPRALHAYALSAAMTEQGEAALAAYRQLLPLLAAWPDPLDRQRIHLEAAAAALRSGPRGLDEAAAELAAARALATSTGLRAVVAGLDALLAERRGEAAAKDSRLDAPEVWLFVARARAGRTPSHWPVLPFEEAAAAASLLIEPYSLVEATELWQRHVQALEHARGAGAWREQAARRLQHLEQLGRRAR